MEPLFVERLPWFVVGPLIGLVLVAVYALGNEIIGASGAYVHVAHFVRRRRDVDMFRVYLFAGMVGGALIGVLLRGGPSAVPDYGALGAAVPLLALIPVLFLGGVLIGYGARWAGGCTSGHGLSGNAVLSPASLVATATFMATAVSVSLLLNWLLGGVL